MSASKDERDRILALLEAGQVSASEAAQLLDALEAEPERLPERGRERVLRLRTTNTHAQLHKVNFSAAIPVSLIRVSLRLGAQLLPQLSRSTLEDLLRSIESGASGRLLDVQDLEQGERLEVFIE